MAPCSTTASLAPLHATPSHLRLVRTCCVMHRGHTLTHTLHRHAGAVWHPGPCYVVPHVVEAEPCNGGCMGSAPGSLCLVPISGGSNTGSSVAGFVSSWCVCTQRTTHWLSIPVPQEEAASHGAANATTACRCLLHCMQCCGIWQGPLHALVSGGSPRVCLRRTSIYGMCNVGTTHRTHSELLCPPHVQSEVHRAMVVRSGSPARSQQEVADSSSPVHNPFPLQVRQSCSHRSLTLVLG